MDAAALRAMQAPYKEKYKSDAESAVITLKAQGSIDESKIACKVETGRALAVAGLHPATGGSGAELCSGDMLLEALVACAGVTLKAVATALDIPLKGKVGPLKEGLDAGLQTQGINGAGRVQPAHVRAFQEKLGAHAAGGGEVGVVQFQADLVVFAQVRGHGALDGGAA